MHGGYRHCGTGCWQPIAAGMDEAHGVGPGPWVGCVCGRAVLVPDPLVGFF